jgi:hypothetical protein
MTIDEYLEHLTEGNWHTLRNLIELERGTLNAQKEQMLETAYQLAIDFCNTETMKLWEMEKN